MELDLASIQAEIDAQLSNMSEEELRAALVDHKAKQRVTSKKYYNPERAKVQRQKRAAIFKAMQERAAELGILEEINDAAGAKADEILANEDD